LFSIWSGDDFDFGDPLSLILPLDPLPEPLKREAADEPPPFLGTWDNIYIAIVVYVGVLIALFYWFSQAFSA
jgi:hypothetical protein